MPAKALYTEQLITYVDPFTKQIIKDKAELDNVSEAAVLRLLIEKALSEEFV